VFVGFAVALRRGKALQTVASIHRPFSQVHTHKKVDSSQ